MMGFSSRLYPGERVMGDGSRSLRDMLSMVARRRGLDLSSRPNTDGYAYSGVAEPFPRELLIPRSEWQARIQEMEERKTRVSDLCEQAGLICKDQGRTNYCWINAPVYCMEVLRVLQNERLVYLSPASAGARIKNFRNVGGWGKEGLEWLSENGVCPVDEWPANAIDRRYDTAEHRELAKQYRVTEWWELRPRNDDEMFSCLLHRIPIASGRSYWSHETTDVDPVWIDGAPAVRDRNSWGMSYGSRGYFILQGNRMRADDAVAPRVVTARGLYQSAGYA